LLQFFLANKIETRMIARKQIEEYCAAIAREFQPEKIILFGSYAYGKPTQDSDVDLLVVMHHRKSARPSLEIRRRISAGFPVDILVRTPAEIAKRFNWGDSFTTEVLTNGRVMYESCNA
jgi:predicted nucleotidyltransferase